jgi:hypothetical protein
VRSRLLAFAAAAAAAVALLTGVTAASAQSGTADQPPECVAIVVGAYQSDGTLTRVHLVFCGNGAGGDSALHDYVNHGRFVLDGGGAIGRDCGSWSAPCVIFPQ